MSATATIYRANAGRERDAASLEALTNRQEMHERSALVWEEMAQRLEDTELLAVRNATAKAARSETSDA
jgi:hypothetical protein